MFDHFMLLNRTTCFKIFYLYVYLFLKSHSIFLTTIQFIEYDQMVSGVLNFINYLKNLQTTQLKIHNL